MYDNVNERVIDNLSFELIVKDEETDEVIIKLSAGCLTSLEEDLHKIEPAIGEYIIKRQADLADAAEFEADNRRDN